ncbi:MAG: PepSY domain-containing protein [Pseudomonadota bacterium]
MPLRYRLRQVHTAFGIVLGVQVLLWMASGFVMSWFSLDHVHGETTTAVIYPAELPTLSYASPGGIIAQHPRTTEVSLTRFQGKAVYIARSEEGAALFDANTGEKLSPLSEEKIREVAKNDYVGAGEIVTAKLMDNPPPEYRKAVPVWQVQFDDPDATRLYVSPQTGEVLSRRNRVWRIFDFFWMLHIMDYDEREDFNNPLLRIAAASGLVFALTGLAMVGFRLKDGRLIGTPRPVSSKRGK